MKRQERMLKIKTEMQGLLEHNELVEIEQLIARCMIIYGLSKRDAKDEVEALCMILNLRKEGSVWVYDRPRK